MNLRRFILTYLLIILLGIIIAGALTPQQPDPLIEYIFLLVGLPFAVLGGMEWAEPEFLDDIFSRAWWRQPWPDHPTTDED